MKKIILHIGTSKTGSSSIQATLSFASNQGKLEPITYFQPQSESKNFLCCIYRPRENIPREFRIKHSCSDELDQTIKTYRREFLTFLADNTKVIISSEALSNLNCKEISRLRADLDHFDFKIVQIVIYVRDPIDHYLSRLQQSLKVSHCPVSPVTYHYNLKNKIRNWHYHFPDQVKVQPFQKEMLHMHCVVRDFLHIASTFFSFDFKDPRVFNINESVSAEGMIILQQYRSQFYPESEFIQQSDLNQLVSLLQRSKNIIPQSKPTLKPSVAHLIRNNHNEVYKWLFNKYGIVFPSYEYSKSNVPPKYVKHWNEESNKLEEILDNVEKFKVNDVLLQILRMQWIE